MLPFALLDGLRNVIDAGRRAPPPHLVAGHVAEGEMMLGRVPDRPLGELEPGAERLQRDIVADDPAEALVADLDVHFFFQRNV